MRNNDFKFRAWIPSENKMVQVSSLHFNKGYNCYEIHVDIPDFDPYEEIILGKNKWRKASARIGFESYVEKNCPFILMQYTGLKDDNGVEIYESDVIQFDIPGLGNYRDIITWLPGKFVVGDFDLSSLDYFLVMGNIYMNKNDLER